MHGNVKFFCQAMVTNNQSDGGTDKNVLLTNKHCPIVSTLETPKTIMKRKITVFLSKYIYKLSEI